MSPTPFLLTAASQISLSHLWIELITNWVGPLFVIVVAVFAIFFIKEGAWMRLLNLVGIAGIVGVLVLTGKELLGTNGPIVNTVKKVAGDTAPTATPTPTPSASTSAATTSTSTPSPEAAPVDMGHAFSIMGIILAALLGLLLVAAVGYYCYNRLRAQGLAARERAALLSQKRLKDEQQWNALIAEGTALVERLMSYRSNMNLLLERPLMISTTDPTTAKAYRAMDSVRRRLNDSYPLLDLNESIEDTTFAQSVSDFLVALEAAEEHAQLQGTQHLGKAGTQAFKRAKLLWAIAEDEAATPAERANAYERVQAELTPYVSLPEDTRKMLTDGAQRLAITS